MKSSCLKFIQNDMKQNRITSAGHSSNTLVSRSQFKPILFSTDMVKAILAGRKTQTRRIVKQAKGWDINWKVMPIKEEHMDGIQRYEIRCGTQYHLPWFKAKCNVGDILWVRETWNCISYLNPENTEYKYFYKADDGDEFSKWKPSLFMPKDACRLFLEVTDVRAERLHDITGDDVLSEGVGNGKSNKAMGVRWENMQRMAFEDLWNKINKNWNDNPYVWVITFKVVECPKGFC